MIGSDARQLQQEYPEYFAQVRQQYRRNFALMVIDSSLFAFVLSLLSQDTIIPYFVDQLSGRSRLVGLVPAVFSLGYMLPQMFGAYLVNGRRTRKWWIFGIAVSERLGLLGIALITQYLGLLTVPTALVLFFGAYLLFSVCAGLISPGYADFISKTIVIRRGLFFGLSSALGGLMGLGASLLAGHWLDVHPFPENVRLIFWVAMAVSFLSPFFIANFNEVPYPVERRPEPLGLFFRSIPAHVRARAGYRRFLTGRALLSFGVMGNAFFALYAVDRFELSPGAFGTFTLVILLSQSAAGLLWGWIGDRYGYRRLYVLGSALVTGMGLVAALAPAGWLFYLVAVGIGGVYAVFNVADANMVYNLTPPDQTSRYIGITNTLIAPIMTIAPLVGGVIVDLVGHLTLFLLVAAIGLVAAAYAIGWMPQR